MALAAPMFALADLSRLSACKISGLCSSTSEERPGDTSLGGVITASSSGSSSAGTVAPTTRLSAFSSRATTRVKAITSARADSRSVWACRTSSADDEPTLNRRSIRSKEDCRAANVALESFRLSRSAASVM